MTTERNGPGNATDRAESVLDRAKAAASQGRVQEALAILDEAIVAAPDRADLHILRARILGSSGGDLVSAARHAFRAAVLEPGNAEYRQAAIDLAARAKMPPPEFPAPAARGSAGGAARTASARWRGFLPTGTAAWAGAALASTAFVAVIGWNLWTWILRPTGAPRALDAAVVAESVPLARLQLMGTTAYGTVTPAWSTLADREKRVERMAQKLAPSGAAEVVLSDAENRIVARGTSSAATIYEARQPPEPRPK